MSELTEFGIAAVKYDLDLAKKNLREREKKLIEAKERLKYMEKVNACDHDLFVAGAYTHVVTECRKCGYSWFD